MNDVLQLPDELMDTIAGGAFTFGGEHCSAVKPTRDGVIFTTASGTREFEWNDETKARIERYGGFLDVAMEMMRKTGDWDAHMLEDYVKPGNGIRG